MQFLTGLSRWLQKLRWTVELQCWAPSPKGGEGRDRSLFCEDTNFVQSLCFFQDLIKLDSKLDGLFGLVWFFPCSFPLCPKFLPLQSSSTTEPQIQATSSRKQSWRRKEASVYANILWLQGTWNHNTVIWGTHKQLLQEIRCIIHVPCSWRRRSPVLFSHPAACNYKLIS